MTPDETKEPEVIEEPVIEDETTSYEDEEEDLI